MRFLALACTLLASSTAVISVPDSREISACCCCDIGRAVIACQAGSRKEDCVCAAVVCPTNAPTVLDGLIEARTLTAEAEKPEECCCCDPQLPAIVCEPRDKPNDCFCLEVACPTDAPTITAEPSQTFAAV